MDNKELIEQLKQEFYFELREIEGRGICGLFRFMFTVAVVKHKGCVEYKNPKLVK